MTDSKDIEQSRTFETRLIFIRDMFTHRYTDEEIFKSSITHKLKISYEQYLKEVEKSIELLKSKDPLKVLKQASKEN